MFGRHDKSETTRNSRVSRRVFLTSGGATVAGAASLGAVGWTASRAYAQRSWDLEADVVVVGTGAAGTVAALRARKEGASVVMLEKGPIFGGTSAKSAAMFWVPNNFRMKERGIADPKADLIKYCARYSYPKLYDPAHPTYGLPQETYDLIAAFYDNASPMTDMLRELKALRIGRFHWMGEDQAADVPDYFEHAEENKAPRGRGLAPATAEGGLGFGAELMGQMKEAVDRLGINVHLNHAVRRVVKNEQGELIGVEAEADGGTVSARARRGVIFATGGYTFNREKLDSLQANPVYGGCGVPTCTGDFIDIGIAAGAKLGNLGSAWRAQIVLEEAIQYVSVPNDVWQPPGDSMVVVNRYGKRIFNEKRNYHDRSKVHFAFDPNEAEFPNQLTFMVYDQRVADVYRGYHPIPEDSAAGKMVISGATWEDLAANIDARLAELKEHTGNIRLDENFVPTLKATVARFNGFADSGKDEDFRRGEFAYDIEWRPLFGHPREDTKWGTAQGKNPVMYPIQDQGPYYCIILAPGTLDTNGGPVINAKAEVVGTDNQPIAGLYGAGNCIANPAHDSYWAGGATLGTGMTFGYVAGGEAAAAPEKKV